MLVNTTIAGTGIESEAVSSDILGANTLFHRDSTDQGSELDRVATLANVTYLRYPGGTVTEEYFDLSDPNSIRNPNVVQLISGNSSPQLRTITPLESFLDYCEIEGTEPVIVLPTYRFFDQETRRLDVDAEPIVKGFIVDILRGSYGSVNIRAFELGNEWYQDRFNWTAEEFGVFQVDLARWVSEAIDDTNVSSPPSILAQAGQTREENIILAGEFEGDDSNYVDGIIAHLYGANSSGNPLGVGGGIAQRLTDISTTWGDVSESLDLAITEWNVGESGEETTLINGIMRSAPLLRIFAEMVRADVDLAAIWTATAPGPAGLGSESNGEVVLTPTGLLFQLLAANLEGKRLQELSDGDRIRSDAGSVVGYQYLFSSEAEDILYLASGVDEEISINANIEFSTSADTYVYATVLGAAPGQDGTLYRSSGSHTLLTNLQVQWNESGMAYFELTLNPYELVQYHFLTGQGVSLSADQQFSIRDDLDGSDYNDTISAFGGNDTLNGHGGNDELYGGHGRDILYGGSGADTLDGGSGNDFIRGGTGNDLALSGQGNNFLDGEGGEDTLSYGDDDDGLRGTLGGGQFSHDNLVDTITNFETISFGRGDNEITVDLSISNVELGGGNDRLILELSPGDALGLETVLTADGGSGLDTIDFSLHETNVSFFLSQRIAELRGGLIEYEGFEVIVGSHFNDRFVGYVEEMVISGGDGDDVFQIFGSTNSEIWGGNGNDLMQFFGPGGVAFGGEGDDFVSGLHSSIHVDSGSGNDTILGSSQDDMIIGGIGNDLLIGNSGQDTFQFDVLSGHDTISDFEIGEDILQIREDSLDGYSASIVSNGLELGLRSGGSIVFSNLQLQDLDYLLDSFVFL